MKEILRENAFFAAANSSRGFVSFFDEIFYAPTVTRRYVIKGGPGTGKSSFMRRVALRAEASGCSVSCYYCSSDTDSLDGVIINGSVAFLDGTAPHACDTVLAGACDEIVDLGEFWDSDRLFEQRESIAAITHEKRLAYSRAYSYLAAAGSVRAACDAFADGACRLSHLKSAVLRILARQAADGEIGRAQTDALGVHGRVRLDTLRRRASEIYAVEDHYGAGEIFMRELLAGARVRGARALVSFDAIDLRTPCELLFCGSGELYTLCKKAPEGERAIGTARFADKARQRASRSVHRASLRAYDTLLTLVESQLKEAGERHARLEEIYVAAMDFSRVQKRCDGIINRVLEGI